MLMREWEGRESDRSHPGRELAEKPTSPAIPSPAEAPSPRQGLIDFLAWMSRTSV